MFPMDIISIFLKSRGRDCSQVHVGLLCFPERFHRAAVSNVETPCWLSRIYLSGSQARFGLAMQNAFDEQQP